MHGNHYELGNKRIRAKDSAPYVFECLKQFQCTAVVQRSMLNGSTLILRRAIHKNTIVCNHKWPSVSYLESAFGHVSLVGNAHTRN